MSNPKQESTNQQPIERRKFFKNLIGVFAGGAIFGKFTNLFTSTANAAPMQSDPFIAEIIMFGGNFAPRGWAFCDGQLLAISSNQALFSLLGTTYGGDGRTTFGLPDLRGRVALHPGSGPGLTPRRLGEKSGAETVTLNTNQIPAHNHTATRGNDATNDPGDSQFPSARIPARTAAEPYSNAAADQVMAGGAITIGSTGGSQSHNNMQPFTAVNFIIALVGVFPSRN